MGEPLLRAESVHIVARCPHCRQQTTNYVPAGSGPEDALLDDGTAVPGVLRKQMEKLGENPCPEESVYKLRCDECSRAFEVSFDQIRDLQWRALIMLGEVEV